MSEQTLSILTSPGNSQIMTVTETLKHQAENKPQKEAFIFYDENGTRSSITFAELFRQSTKFCSVMQHLEIKAKDVVCIITLNNNPDCLIIYFGLMMLGAIPLITAVSTKDCSNTIYFVKKVNAKAIILPTEDTEEQYYDALSKPLKDTTVKVVISSDAKEDNSGRLSLKHLMRTQETHDTKNKTNLDIDDVAVMMSTSGTTGLPKVVCHSYRNLYKMFNRKQDSTLHEIKKSFSTAAFGWLGGIPIREILNGTTRVTTTGRRWRSDIQKALKIVEKESCNTLELSPGDISTIILQNIPIPESVWSISTGGAPIPGYFQKILERVDAFWVGYALMETGVVSRALYTKNTTVKANIAGKPTSGVTIKVVDDNAEVVRRGVQGKIMVKTPYPCISYLEEKGFSTGEWIDTKDIGYISEEGELFVIGRDADYITTGMYTYSVCYIEQMIANLKIDGLLEVVVVPVPDKIAYQQPCACVVKEPESMLTDKMIQQILDKNILGKTKPKYILFVDFFPRNQNGKVEREILKDIAVNALHLSE